MAHRVSLSIEGFATSVAVSESGKACVATASQGIHIIQTFPEVRIDSLSASAVPDPLCCCFLSSSDVAVVGTLSHSLAVVGFAEYSGDSSAVLQTHSVVPLGRQNVPLSVQSWGQENTWVLTGTSRGAVVSDVSNATTLFTVDVVPDNAVGATRCGDSLISVATCDGHVLYFDIRAGPERPTMISCFPGETLSAIASCTLSGTSPDVVSVGCASGRIYLTRGVSSFACERAFSTGRTRSMIRSLSMTRSQIFAGHMDGRVSGIVYEQSSNGGRELPGEHCTSSVDLSAFLGAEKDSEADWTSPCVGSNGNCLWALLASSQRHTSAAFGIERELQSNYISIG